jgi:uncharacterized membrane protein YjjP (DUF1212 family)
MSLIKVEGIRYILFCIGLMLLIYLDWLTPSIFFIGSASFVFLNYLLSKRDYNISVKNVYFNIVFIGVVLYTIILANVYFLS